MKSVLFYSDAPQFGGHEAMTLEAVRCVCRNHDVNVSAMFYEGNSRFQSELAAIAESTGNLSLIPLQIKAGSLQAFRSLLSIKKVNYVKGLMKRLSPDLVLVSQGRIEASSLGVLAAKRAGFRTLSYLPMAHEVSVSGTPFAIRIREKVNRHLYSLPDKFITISEHAREMLYLRGVTQTISVVPNCVTVQPATPSEGQNFRSEHGISPTEYVVGVVARIDFRQKAQDFAVEAISQSRHKLAGFKFVFVGEGPDERKLAEMIASRGLSPIVQRVPWCDNPGKVYAGLNMLLIPSRFEGVPLVMLEAMLCELPVVAANIDGMAELLPPDWLFPVEDPDAVVSQILSVKKADNTKSLEFNRNRVMQDFSTTRFCDTMCEAILERKPARALCAQS